MLAACDKSGGQQPLTAPIYNYQVIKVYPHDKSSFTEGLLMNDGWLYESDGLVQQSRLRRIDLASSKVIQEYRLPDQYFAEGLAIMGDRIYQLTYTSHIGFVYDRKTFQLLKTFNYPSEGWGLTSDGNSLIMSNGSASLNYLDPETLQTTRTVDVHEGDHPVDHLNELEYINGKIYANIFPSSMIAIIEPDSGEVSGWIDLINLYPCKECAAFGQVANGIAYDEKNDAILVTGKDWPSIYAIRLIKH